MKKCLITTITLIVSAVFVFSVGINSSDAAEKQSVKGVTIGSAPMGSTYFVLLSGWGDLISKKMGVKAAVESTGGPAANIVLLNKKQMDLGATTNLVMYQGLRGEDWAKGQKYQDIRTILPLYPATYHIYAPSDRGIKTIHDLTGKRVCTGPAATTPGIIGPVIFKIFGIKPAKVVNIGWSDANAAVQDGMLDAVQPLMGLPAPSCVELSATHDVTIVGVSKEDIKKLKEQLPLVGETIIPANTYKNQTKDIPTIDLWSYLVTRKDMPDDFVYELCKVTIDNVETLKMVHESASYIKKLEVLNDSVVPLHPGAIRYLREKGITVPQRLIPQ